MTSNYYQKHKKSFKKKHLKDIKIFLKKKKKRQKMSRNRYQNLFEEKKKGKKDQYHCECNKNLSEEKKQKHVECMRNYYLTHKNCLVNL